MNEWVSDSISVSCDFSLVLFLLFFVLLMVLVFALSYDILFYYYPLKDCLFSIERQKEGGI